MTTIDRNGDWHAGTGRYTNKAQSCAEYDLMDAHDADPTMREKAHPWAAKLPGGFDGPHYYEDESYDSTLSDLHYNARGTAAFPPAPRSAAQHLMFWDNVRLPDAMVLRAYKQYQEAVKVACSEPAHEQATASATGGMGRVPSDVNVERLYDVVYDRVYEELRRDWPQMRKTEARNILRACLTWDYASGNLNGDELKAVAGHLVQVGSDDMHVITVVERYHWDTWRDGIGDDEAP